MAKILLVDDNPKNIQVLANTLSSYEYEIEFAENGQEAISLVNDEVFDLILMDVMMPVMNGFDACAEIKTIENKKDIPVIFLTAKTDEESISTGFNVGGVDYVTKPFNANELIARVKTHIELKNSRDVLQNMNAVLEEKVKERTSELNEANVKLNEANKELTILDKAKNQFLNIISHELRTPLNGMTGAMHLLKKHVETKNMATLVDLLNTSVNRLEKFTSQALKITHLQTGVSQLNYSTINLNDALESCFLNLSNLIVENETEIITSDEFKQINFLGDIDLITMAFDKIIENAIKHSPSGGKVVVSTKNSDEYIHLLIADSGEGFKGDISSKFEVFSTGESHVNNNPGLDLALVKLIITNHKGSVSAYNANEGGAVVEIKLPKNMNK